MKKDFGIKTLRKYFDSKLLTQNTKSWELETFGEKLKDFWFDKTIFHHIKCWMDFKIVFGQNPLTNDFAILVKDHFGLYKV